MLIVRLLKTVLLPPTRGALENVGSSVAFEEDAPGSLFNEVHWPSASVSGANEVLILAILIAFAEREAVVPKSSAAATFPVFFGWLVVTLNAFLYCCVLSGHRPDNHQIHPSSTWSHSSHACSGWCTAAKAVPRRIFEAAFRG